MIKKIEDFLIFWLPVFGYVFIIYVFSSMRGEDLPKLAIPQADRIFHLVLYFVFGALLMRAFLNSKLNLNIETLVILSIFIASLYAFADEWHQSFVPGRCCDPYDMLADYIGLNVGIFLNVIRW